jgi:lipopolysaccharide transport system permease protein
MIDIPATAASGAAARRRGGMTTAAAVWRDLAEMVREQRDCRELLLQMTRRDLLLRYKQTVMGFGWALFMPVLNTVIFSIIFMRVAHVDTGAPYPLFAYCGLVTWNFFASATRFAVGSLTANGSLVTKVYFPREILPFTAVLVALTDLLVGGVVLAGMMIYYGIALTPAILLLPVIIAIQLAFTAGISLLLAMANLFYRDVKYLFEVLITVWMFATSVLYPTALVGGRFAQLLALNPLTPIIDAYRSVLVFQRLPPLDDLAYATAVSAVTLVGGWLVFHRSEFAFAENI